MQLPARLWWRLSIFTSRKNLTLREGTEDELMKQQGMLPEGMARVEDTLQAEATRQEDM